MPLIRFAPALLLLQAMFVFGGDAPPADDLPTIKLVKPYPKRVFNRPLFVGHAGDGSGRLFLLEQDGKILILPKEPEGEPAVFFNIVGKTTRVDNEEGLLSFAFDPNFKTNGFFYVWYSVATPHQNVLARFSVSKTNPNVADMASEKILIEVPKPFGNHNGGTVLFGKDGYLYLSIGDGGKGDDPYRNAQNLNSHLGKILRIDVSKEENGKPYAIPKDNPFAGRADAKPEVYALGCRNMWRMSFDRETGALFAGDVGQDKWEEVDLIVKGGNYGWNLREGRVKFERSPDAAASEKVENFTNPIWMYDRKMGTSITGGYVYRGKRIPALVGAYVCGDYTLGNIFGVKLKDNKAVGEKILLNQPKNICSFGEDADGELYVMMFDGNLFEIHPAN
jgi:glucose/arabinose dehydrogenase